MDAAPSILRKTRLIKRKIQLLMPLHQGFSYPNKRPRCESARGHKFRANCPGAHPDTHTDRTRIRYGGGGTFLILRGVALLVSPC